MFACSLIRIQRHCQHDRPTPLSCRTPLSNDPSTTSILDCIFGSASIITHCEGGNRESEMESKTQTSSNSNNAIQHQQQIAKLQRELDEEDCSACMYTGMATCAGLSLYFVKLATDDTTLNKHRRFLWICSAGWVVAGAYRWYLGKELKI
jgi:hypothetical protein